MKRLGCTVLLCILLVSLCGCQSKEARSVDSLIMAIGEVDTSCGPVVEYVRNAYEALSVEERASLENYHVLLSSEAAYVDALIDAIGEVTPESAGDIALAEEAYHALHEDAKPLVRGGQELQTAREICEWKTLYSTLSGIWVNEVTGFGAGGETRIGRGLIRNFGLDETNCHPVAVKSAGEGDDLFQADSRQFELREDGILLHDAKEIGTWEMTADMTEVILHAVYSGGEQLTYTLKILEESGFTKLVGAVFENQAFGYVKEADYLDAFREKYVAAELSKDNIHDYIGDPVLVGQIMHEDEKTYNAYVYPSHAYENGLVYMGSSCVIQVDYVHGGRKDCVWEDFPAVFLTKLKMKDVMINTESRLSGEIYYVKKEYVADNYINEDGFRVLELTNGINMVFDGYSNTIDTFWNRTELDYSDYKY